MSLSLQREEDIPLGRHGRRIFTDRCDLYAVERGVDPATGKPYGEQVRRVGVNLPLYYDYTANQDSATPVGRIKRDLLETTDILHFPVGVNVSNDYWIINRTLLYDGRPCPQWGVLHKAIGAPLQVPNRPRRPVGTQIVYAAQEENAPASLLELLPKTLAEWETSL